MQLPVASFVPCLRPILGGSLPSWLRVGCLGLCKQGVFLPNQPSPRRRTSLEWVYGHGDHPPSSRDHGARGSQDPPWPMRRNGLSETWTTIAFLSKEALGLRLVTGAQFRFTECSFPIRGLCYVCIGPQLGPSRGGERRVAGACANQAFSCQISHLPKGEHVWSGFLATECTHQAAGPRSQRQPRTSLALWGAKGQVRTRQALLS